MGAAEAPASVSQRLLWMIQHYRADFGALSCPLLCRLSGPLDPDRLRGALDALTRRHESLRTTFRGRGARLVQVIHPPRPMPFRMRDLSSSADPQGALARATAAELARPIPVDEWPARATVWRVAAGDHMLCVNLHHLVSDAYSTGVLLGDLAACYAHPHRQREAVGWSYARFAEWQRDLLGGAELDRQRGYWRTQLAGSTVPRLGRATGPRPGGPAVAVADLPVTAVEAARGLAQRAGTTLFAVLLAAFYAHVHRLTGQTDVAVASMFANRSRPDVRQTVGLMANMVMLRAPVDPRAPFVDLVRGAHRTAVGALAHQDMPFQMLPRDTVDDRQGRPDDTVFNVMAGLLRAVTFGDLTFELVLPVHIGSRFPLELAVVPMGAQPRVILFRADDRMDDEQADAFLGGYPALVRASVTEPHRPIADLVGGARRRGQLATSCDSGPEPGSSTAACRSSAS